MGCIYRAYCPASGKFYVGQTKHESWRDSYRTRFTLARSRAKNGKPTTLWERAMVKYGRAGLQFRNLIAEVESRDIDQLERFFIAQLKSNDSRFGYNIEAGGSLIKEMSDSTRKKISEAGAIMAKWFHKEHGFITAHASGVAKKYGVPQSSMTLVRQGVHRSCRGWVCLTSPAFTARGSRPLVWRHKSGIQFIGSAVDLVAKFKATDNRLRVHTLCRAVRGVTKTSRGWVAVRRPTYEEEIEARVEWATQPYSDAQAVHAGPRRIKSPIL